MRLHEVKKLLHNKQMVTKLKNGRKIFASCTIEKGMITRIYGEFKKLNSQKFTDPVKKWANKLNTAFSREEVQMAKKKKP
jgi:hypothetical protein